MRRTKSNTLHPASQVIAAALSQYQDGKIEPILYRPGGPQDSLWHDLPILPVTESWCIVKKYDFHNPKDVDLTTLWDQMKDDLGSTEPSIAEIHGGGMFFKTGPVPGESYSYLIDQYKIYEFNSGKKTWFETTITQIDTDADEGSRPTTIHVGFADEITLGEYFMSPVVPTNGILLDHYELNGGIFEIDVYKNGELIFNSGGSLSGVSFLDGKPHKLGMRITPNEIDPNKFDVYVFGDDEYIGSVIEVEIPRDIQMGVIIGSYSHNDETTMNQIIVIQEKDTE